MQNRLFLVAVRGDTASVVNTTDYYSDMNEKDAAAAVKYIERCRQGWIYNTRDFDDAKLVIKSTSERGNDFIDPAV